VSAIAQPPQWAGDRVEAHVKPDTSDPPWPTWGVLDRDPLEGVARILPGLDQAVAALTGLRLQPGIAHC